MDDGHLERILLGIFLPPLIGGFLFFVLFLRPELSLLFSLKTITDFLSFLMVAYAFMGVQSLIFSLLMEFFIQKFESNKLVYMFASFIGAMSGFILLFHGIIIGLFVGFIVSYWLRLMYIKQLTSKLTRT